VELWRRRLNELDAGAILPSFARQCQNKFTRIVKKVLIPRRDRTAETKVIGTFDRSAERAAIGERVVLPAGVRLFQSVAGRRYGLTVVESEAGAGF
jgi:hypothetical protein